MTGGTVALSIAAGDLPGLYALAMHGWIGAEDVLERAAVEGTFGRTELKRLADYIYDTLGSEGRSA